MTLKELNEMFSAGDLGPAIEWDETPSDVKDFDGNPSKLPIDTSILTDKKKRKKKIARRPATNTLTINKENI